MNLPIFVIVVNGLLLLMLAYEISKLKKALKLEIKNRIYNVNLLKNMLWQLKGAMMSHEDKISFCVDSVTILLAETQPKEPVSEDPVE